MHAMSLAHVVCTIYEGRCTVHGFRSSFRDWASEQTSMPHAIAEVALAHRGGGDVERSYTRSDLFDRGDLMDRGRSVDVADVVTLTPSVESTVRGEQ